MSKYLGIESAKYLLKELFEIERVRCPQFAGERPCITCDNRERCTVIKKKKRDFGETKLTLFGNSAMLSIRLPLKSDIEQFIWKKLAKSLEKESDFLMVKPEKGFDLTFYTKFGRAISMDEQFITIERILDFLSENPWFQAKMLLNDWIERTMDKLDIKIRRELPKILLTEAPKIERSKIFEPKRSVSTEQISPIEEQRLMKEIKQSVQKSRPNDSTEPTPLISEDHGERSKLPKQPFFVTAKERENEYASWPKTIKREEPEGEEPIDLGKPPVSDATKEVETKKSTIEDLDGLKGDKNQLKISEERYAEDESLESIPTNESFEILVFIEKLVEKDYEMRKLAVLFEKGMQIIRKNMFYTDFLTEMGKVTNELKRAGTGLKLSKSNKDEILKKISKWKSSPIWKSYLRRKK